MLTKVSIVPAVAATLMMLTPAFPQGLGMGGGGGGGGGGGDRGARSGGGGGGGPGGGVILVSRGDLCDASLPVTALDINSFAIVDDMCVREQMPCFGDEKT